MENWLAYIDAPFLVISLSSLAFFLIYKEKLGAAIGMLLVNVVFLLLGYIRPSELLAGFSNTSIASIILLILITAGLRKNFDVQRLFNRMFLQTRSYKLFLFKMTSQVAFLSAFVNNTPVVALLTPYVVEWGKKNKISPSKLLIPLSFATIMGGMITLIGTSTTLVLNGFITKYNHPSLPWTDLAIVGLVVTITGVLFLTFFANYLLPENKDLLEDFKINKREYLVETLVKPESKLIGKSVSAAGLRNLKGVYLVEILRGDKKIYPVSPNETIKLKDVLIFAGNISEIIELTSENNGLDLPKIASTDFEENAEIIECVLGVNSSLIGKKVNESDFRKRYNAAIVAIHRNGEKLSGKIGEQRLMAGDLLLVFAGHDFMERIDLYRDIYTISSHKEISKNNQGAKRLFGGVLILGISLLVFGLINLFTCLLIIVSFMGILKLLTLQDIKRELDFNLIALLVLSLALGQVIINTNTGQIMALGLMEILQDLAPIYILAGMMLFIILLSSFISNVGAVSIGFPIALSVADQLSLDPLPFFMGLAFAASAAFITPFGYQTNLIIYGPGAYRFKDFIRIGFPVAILYFISCLSTIAFLYKDTLIP